MNDDNKDEDDDFSVSLHSIQQKDKQECNVRQIMGENKVWLVDHVFSTEECKVLIDVCERNGFEIKYSGGRHCLRLLKSAKSFASILWTRVEPYILKEIETISGDKYTICHEYPLHSNFSICKYEPGHKFSSHIDHPINVGKEYQSFLTLMLYLNDNFEGGNTNFFEPPNSYGKVEGQPIIESIRPQPGLAIIFLQGTEHKLWHEGSEITNGYKYIMRTSVMYKKVNNNNNNNNNNDLLFL